MYITEEQQAVFNQIVEMSETAYQAAEFVYECMKSGRIDAAMEMIDNLEIFMDRLKLALEGQSLEELLISRHVLCCDNILHSVEQVKKAHREQNLELAKRIVRCEIVTAAYILNEQLIYWLTFFHDEQKRKEFSELYTQRLKEDIAGWAQREYKYDVSICVVGYNQLEYTKQAVESIYKYTNFKKYKVEIITYNNGSSDGTEELFESLPNEKKVNLKNNLIGYPSYNNLFEGKYVIGFSNDVIATEGWLDNLLEGMENHPDVLIACPVCNGGSISNMQGVPVPYQNRKDHKELEKMQAFAAKFNRTQKKSWSYKSNLMPFLAIYKNVPTYIIRGCDPAFYLGEFGDDDTSTVLRRAGIKTAVARDTFVHHYGSITLGAGGAENRQDALDKMRQVFYQKWGVDAWESRFYFSEYGTVLEQLKDAGQNLKLLFVETMFGYGLYDILNIVADRNIKVATCDAMIVDKRYREDALGMCDKIYEGRDIFAAIDSCENQYDYIFLGNYLPFIAPLREFELIEKLYDRLRQGGKLLFSIENMLNAEFLSDLLANGGGEWYGEDTGRVFGLNPNKFIAGLKRKDKFQDMIKIHVDNALELQSDRNKRLIRFIGENGFSNMNRKELELMLSCIRLSFVITKKGNE